EIDTLMRRRPCDAKEGDVNSSTVSTAWQGSTVC
ncbi:unnamed protein product, partial [Allacma fusca]